MEKDITGMISKVDPVLRNKLVDWVSRWMKRLAREAQAAEKNTEHTG